MDTGVVYRLMRIHCTIHFMEVVKLSAHTCMHTCNSSNSVLNFSESDKINSGRQGPNN